MPPQSSVIIRLKKKEIVNEVSSESQPPPPPPSHEPEAEIESDKPIIIRKVKKKTITNEEIESQVETSLGDDATIFREIMNDTSTLKDININIEQLKKECSLIFTKKKDEKMTKEVFIEMLECEKIELQKTKANFTNVQYETKMKTICSILSRYKVGWMNENIQNINVIRKNIDQSVKKIPEKQIKQKIDMNDAVEAVRGDGKDPQILTLVDGRKHFVHFDNKYNKVSPEQQRKQKQIFRNKSLTKDLKEQFYNNR